MSGKKKQPGAKHGGWGGRRPGSGRKPKYMLPEHQLRAMLRKARKWGKERGQDMDEFLLAVIAGDMEALGVDNVPLRDRITCVKLYKEFTMQKTSEQNINVNQQLGPRIGLPPIRKIDPALEIVKGGRD